MESVLLASWIFSYITSWCLGVKGQLLCDFPEVNFKVIKYGAHTNIFNKHASYTTAMQFLSPNCLEALRLIKRGILDSRLKAIIPEVIFGAMPLSELSLHTLNCCDYSLYNGNTIQYLVSTKHILVTHRMLNDIILYTKVR
jgi:hypothetical protein